MISNKTFTSLLGYLDRFFERTGASNITLLIKDLIEDMSEDQLLRLKGKYEIIPEYFGMVRIIKKEVKNATKKTK